MKKIIVCLSVLMFVCVSAHSEILVVSDKTTKQVEHVVNDENELVLSSSDMDRLETTVMPGNLSDYDLTEQLTDYKMVNKKFVINTKKISDRENAAEQVDLDNQKKEQDFQSAKAKLMALGLTADECEALR